MRSLLVVFLVALAGCPRPVSNADRDALQDFRTVDRACLAKLDEILRDESMHLSDTNDLVLQIRVELVKPWREMRARMKLEERKLGDELTKVLGRYVDERELAWTSLATAIEVEYNGIQTTVNHRWQYRESTDAANADAKIIGAKLAGLKLPALPPLAAAPIVELDPPPPVTTPGAAYFLVGRNVVRLDDKGFATIATDIDTMDVLPDGTMWACSMWHLAHWDGTKTTDYKPKLPVTACAAGPDGVVWVLNDRHYDNAVDQLGRFDGTTWKITTAAIGDASTSTEALLVDREGRLYALDRGSSGGDGVFILDKTWRQLALQKVSESSYINHLVRGGDGAVWATYQVASGGKYPSGVARLLPAGGDEPTYIADYFQQEQIYPFIDAAGRYTVLDPRRNVLEQANKKRTLPMPVAQRYYSRDAGPVWIDGAGRIWLDLVDGINVIEKGGKRTIYPRGSIDGIRENVKTIVVTGAGPALVTPPPVVTRTITGQLRDGGKLELWLCGDPWSRECPPGLPVWKTWSDAEGNFTFENVPRWTFSIQGLVGISGSKVWRVLDTKCCADGAVLEPATFHREAVY